MNPDILATPFHYSVTWDSRSGPPAAFVARDAPEVLNAATSMRRAEFAAGRFCATKAIEAMNFRLSRQVGIHRDGYPLWPEGVVGSITHTEGFASAAVASNAVCWSLGIDSENLTVPKVLQAVQDLTINDREKRLVCRLPFSEEHALILIFSAKESVYKCLFPLVQRPFDFAVIGMDEIDDHNRTFTFRLSESLHADFPKGYSAQGRFEFSQNCVHTAVEFEKAPF